MNAATRRAAVKRLLLVAWAMGTLILVFVVVLLASEMVRQGKDPLAPVKKPAAPPLPPPAREVSLAPSKEITLYFADAESRRLVPESCRIEPGDSTVENCRKALEALIRGPRDILTPIIPSSTKVRGLYLLEGGELVVDFSIDLEMDLKRIKSTSLEGLMFYGIANTLTQPALQGGKEPAVSKVRFLIDDSVPQESFPAHIDVSMPIGPDPRWIAQTQE
jgi:hypothetical protein